MRWPVVLVLAYVAVGLELGLKPALLIGPVNGPGIAPSFVIPLLVFVAMSAPHVATLWTGLLFGLVIDLTSSRAGGTIVVGPNALGFMGAAYLVLLMRSLLLRKNWFTLVFMSVLASLLASLIAITFYSMRAVLGDSTPWEPLAELLRGFFSSLYTAVSALAMSAMLLPMQPMVRFAESSRPFASRRYN